MSACSGYTKPLGKLNFTTLLFPCHSKHFWGANKARETITCFSSLALPKTHCFSFNLISISSQGQMAVLPGIWLDLTPLHNYWRNMTGLEQPHCLTCQKDILKIPIYKWHNQPAPRYTLYHRHCFTLAKCKDSSSDQTVENKSQW